MMYCGLNRCKLADNAQYKIAVFSLFTFSLTYWL